QDQHGASAAVRGPEIVDLAQSQVFDGEAGARQACGDERLAACVVGRDRRPRDQRTGKFEDLAHVPVPPIPKRRLKPLSVKPCVTWPASVTTTGRRISCGYSRDSSCHSASLAAALRLSGSCRHVVEDLLTMAGKPPSFPAQSSRVSGVGLLSR